jgi:hypothetical protein
VRLEPLSVFRWSYDEDGRVKAGYTIVSAYRIEGTVVWSNYPRRRTDGRMLPNLRGLITTNDGVHRP